jgi:CHRD domain
MRVTAVLVAFVAALAFASAAYAQELEFETELSGAAERPTPVETEGSGEAKFESDGTSVEFELKWDDLSTPAFAGHIHCGGPEETGPVGVTLFAAQMDTEGEVQAAFSAPDAGNGCGWQDLADVLGAMATGDAYVNVHTTQHPGGEVRGQIAAELKFETELSGAAERPTPVETEGSGEAKFESDGTSVEFELKWDDLSTPAFAGHIHCGGPEETGPVGVTLFAAQMDTNGEVQDAFTAPDSGNGCGWQDLADVLGAMATGDAYVNVHTTQHPGGEVRGQIAAD